MALTETTLIHTLPLQMSAHMAIMEDIMNLFVKEVVSAERVVAAIRRFADLDAFQSPRPKEAEQVLLLWINKACQSLKKWLTAEADGNVRERFIYIFLGDPNNIFHLGFEDIVYMHSTRRGSLQERDLTKRLTVYEVVPSATNSSHTETTHAAGLPSIRIDPESQDGDDSKTFATFYTVVSSGEGAIKEGFNMDTKIEERGKDCSPSWPADVPSNCVSANYADRRSRNNSNPKLFTWMLDSTVATTKRIKT